MTKTPPQLPNFLILGVAKAGTSSLFNYLSQHPQIFGAQNKEPHFFTHEGMRPDYRGPGDEQRNPTFITHVDHYKKLFSGSSSETIRFEASNTYLFSEHALQRIKRHVPQAKLMVMLRNPVDRAYSNFLYQRKFGREPLSDFGQAFAQEASRIRQNWNPFWYYKQNGYYYIPVNRYLDTFGPNQFKIFLYDDWNAKNLATLKAIFQFLEVDETFIPNIASRQNRASMPRSLLMAGFLHQRNALRTALEAIGKKLLPKRSRFAIFRLLEKANHRQPPRLDPDLRAQLIQEYRDDILRLQDLIQRDLSIWLE